MPIVVVILILLVAGIVLAFINKYGASHIDAKFVQLINLVAIVAAIVWLLKVFHVWQYLWSITV